jgi:hypothetical protein
MQKEEEAALIDDYKVEYHN